RVKDDLPLQDVNSRYFHNKVNYRKRISQIDSIQSNIGVWLSDRSSIASELREHFSKISRTTNPDNSDDFLTYLCPCITED
ncbi:hypothetical protein MKW92_049593, partial [Papaver armeniacum]